MVAGLNKACRRQFQRALHARNVTVNIFRLCNYVPLFLDVENVLRFFTCPGFFLHIYLGLCGKLRNSGTPTLSQFTEWMITESVYIILMMNVV